MTTKYMKTTAMPLYKFNGETYCRMLDVVRMIHHEFFETDNKDFRDILDRMEMRLTKNEFLNAPKCDIEGIPPRYAVGREDGKNWLFYVDSKDGKPTYSDRPCMAKLYTTYRNASACADFLDGEWDVLDWEANMTEEERWVRELRIPYDADEGNEKAIPVEVVT